ncbi:hypothetical protein PAPYR_1648 [Paratrimastix pyriformis]|uniref:Uncharacterized protein n=1 Tax=Paratrimastix pyriformis TaxID=342808 RepID=A0ABQ8UTT7_9EUKA|nr:hypothetical protein PAPYR_1648 [Paratrimastix pyriformis]
MASSPQPPSTTRTPFGPSSNTIQTVQTFLVSHVGSPPGGTEGKELRSSFSSRRKTFCEILSMCIAAQEAGLGLYSTRLTDAGLDDKRVGRMNPAQ